MVEYKCDRCHKIFNRKSTYDDHLKRKNPCKLISENKMLDKYGLLIKKIKELEEDNQKLRKDNEDSKKEINEIKNIMNKSAKQVTNGKIVEGDDKSKNLYVININKFGNENDSTINLPKSKKILNRGYMAIPEYIKTLHFDEELPENHNVYISNWRDRNSVLVYDGKSWNIQEKDDVLDDLKTKGINFIQKKYDELDKNNKEDALTIKKIERFLLSFNENEKEKMETLNKDILLVLYNNRKITEKTKNKICV